MIGLTLLVLTPPASGTFTGENGRIAFARTVSGTEVVFTVRPDGSGLKRLTHLAPGVNAFWPDWSPNGRWVAYTRIGEEVQTHIFRIRRNGTDRQDLSKASCPPETCSAEYEPAWSPDGERLAYTRETRPGGGTRIYIKDADGANPKTLVPFRRHTRDFSPQWSPGGKRVVFVRWEIRRGYAIFVVRRDGTDRHRLTPWRLNATAPDWSPNGRWIVFSAGATDAPSAVWLMHPSGGNRHPITTSSGGTVTWGTGSFSPDGERITAIQAEWNGAGSDPGPGDIYVLSKRGDIVGQLTQSPLDDSDPDWGPRPQ